MHHHKHSRITLVDGFTVLMRGHLNNVAKHGLGRRRLKLTDPRLAKLRQKVLFLRRVCFLLRLPLLLGDLGIYSLLSERESVRSSGAICHPVKHRLPVQLVHLFVVSLDPFVLFIIIQHALRARLSTHLVRVRGFSDRLRHTRRDLSLQVGHVALHSLAFIHRLACCPRFIRPLTRIYPLRAVVLATLLLIVVLVPLRVASGDICAKHLVLQAPVIGGVTSGKRHGALSPPCLINNTAGILPIGRMDQRCDSKGVHLIRPRAWCTTMYSKGESDGTQVHTRARWMRWKRNDRGVR
mmetsp:Transcript_32371/g.85051  ORF Transcript_32371/g.85051 Transcript_32371/m.85051 type:complete len:295 (-) Transcript_32371:28-912(-)